MRDERPRLNVCIYASDMLPSTFLAKGKLSCLPADEHAVLAVMWFPCSCWWHISICTNTSLGAGAPCSVHLNLAKM
jgi:hypothetical protein